MRPTDSQPVLLIGSKPNDAAVILHRLGIPFVIAVDPTDGPVAGTLGALDLWTVPFKSDPLSVLTLLGKAPISAVLSFTELGLFPAALLAHALGLPGSSVAAVLRTRNKLLMRLLLAARVRQPAFGLVGEQAPATFPVIVKPVDGSGSRGVTYVEDQAEYQEICARSPAHLWEEFLPGPEFSVETVTRGGAHRAVGVTEKFTTGKPFFVETGHLVPARVHPEESHRLIATTFRVLDLLGVNQGAAHTELKLVDGDAVLVETHTRPGGDRIPLLHQLVTGQDQYTLSLPAQLGVEAPSQQPKFPWAGVSYFCWSDGTLDRIDGLGDAQDVPGLVELDIAARTGDRLAVWRYSHERPGHCVVGGSSPQEVVERLREVERRLSVHYRNRPLTALV